MESVINYVYGVIVEGVVVGALFWSITYITMESTSLRGALGAALASEAVGNIPYLFGLGALEAPTLGMTLIGGVVFIRMILRVGELTAFRATYGLAMTYFTLVAIVACS
ncbi:MAG: hypothetical protein GKR90_12000 [Pseudomonadales bacterium]|nr:hypothetical protein [Pseudomonadales bacterium]